MMSTDVVREGERIMTICNACRYCEGFCAVFPAVERRLNFAAADMNYLANLCHNCTECLQACQYAPPHPFAVNVPKTLARIRLRSYQQYCWPQSLGFAFRLHGVASALGLACLLIACLAGATFVVGRRGISTSGEHANFYGVVPHGVMVAVFGTVFLLVVTAMVVAVAHYVKDTRSQPGAADLRSIGTGLRNALTLKFMHGSGEDCTIRESIRTPWRRWFHHFTLYGFLLCLASTTVAAFYHVMLDWTAPYPFFSLPVMLGTLGGIGLLAGPIGLWALRDRRDPAAVDADQQGLDRGFILVLVLTSATGLALLAYRDSTAMGMLLIVHLAFVLTLFIMLPYGKFVHGLYRTAALIQYAKESQTP